MSQLGHIIPHTLILGMAVGMKLAQLKPFFLSLEKAGYRGDVCLVVGDLEPEVLAFLRARGINLLPFQKAYLKHKWSRLAPVCKLFMKPWQQQRFDEQMLQTYLHLHCARHLHFRNYLAECGGGYDSVMLADTRDIVFQRDPFDFDRPTGLGVFLEDAGQTIGTDVSNATWIRDGYGPDVLEKMADKRIYCAGTIFGSPLVMRNYLDQVLALYAARRPVRTIDQATENFILHQQPPPDWQAFGNETGPIFTMANVPAEQIRFNEAGLLVNAAGRVFNTLHQYDRHPALMPQLLARLT